MNYRVSLGYYVTFFDEVDWSTITVGELSGLLDELQIDRMDVDCKTLLLDSIDFKLLNADQKNMLLYRARSDDKTWDSLL